VSVKKWSIPRPGLGGLHYKKTSWWTSDLGIIGYISSNNELRLYCRQNKDRLLPSGAIYEELKRITQLFCILKQSNKAVTYDSRVASSRQNLNVVVKIYHEGKTPGSILCGPIYAHGCALLVLIRVYDAKKILVDALGTLRTTGIHSL
jgi:hypothetical protein